MTPTPINDLLDRLRLAVGHLDPHPLDGDDRPSIVRNVERLQAAEWSDGDIIKFCLLTEDFNPGLGEERALFLMRQIRDKYPTTKGVI